MSRCTENQARFLEARGYDTSRLTFDQASDLIDKVKKGGRKSAPRQEEPRRERARREEPREEPARRQPPRQGRSDNPTEKQAGVLRKYGKDPRDFSFQTASDFIGDLAERGWPDPKSFNAKSRDTRYADDPADDDYDDYDDEPQFA